MINPLFSIIIPTYNRANFIAKTIESFLQQTYSNFEIIVIDDGSTDNTETVINTIKDKRVLYYKKINEERGAARNFGAQKAKGDYLNFFDSDDLAYPNHLSTAIKTIKSHNNPNVFALNFEIKDSSNKILKKGNLNNVNSQLIIGNVLSTNGVFLKKEIAIENPFSEVRKLSISEDYFLWLNLAAKYTIIPSNIITSSLIEHEGRSMNNVDAENLIFRRFYILDKIESTVELNNYYKPHLNKMKASSFLFISSNLAAVGLKKIAIQYLIKSIKLDVTFLFNIRTIITIKNILLK